jgi:hemoglobin
MPAIERLMELFYRVPADPMLAPLFRDMPPDHPRHVAQFVAEVFGGPKAYTARGYTRR